LRVTMSEVCCFPLRADVVRSLKYECSYWNYNFFLEKSVCYSCFV